MRKEKRDESLLVNEEPLKLGAAALGYQRLPFWLETAAGHNFAWLHLPHDRTENSMGIVICNPLGYEYTHAHRSVRHLADQLATHHYPTLRFDLHGMGDSSGDLFDEDLFNCWMVEINAAIDTLKSQFGLRSICLIGLRMGATLAAKVAEDTAIEHLVLWNPIANGRRYVREMQALDWMSDRVREDDNNYIESAGFIINEAVAAKIKKIKLGKPSYKLNGKVLVVHRDDLASETDWVTKLEQQGIAIDEITVPGYAAMMAEPHETEVPSKAIAEIVNWLDENKCSNNSSTLSIDFRDEIVLAHKDNIKLREKICLLGRDRNIFGILSRPSIALASQTPLIVFVNSGSVHHVGPNRLYVELCRALSTAGFACLRIDLANLGDSAVGCPANENHPYPDHANADVNAVIDSVTADLGFTQVVLTGLCSGAHTAFHVGLNNAAVCESIMINPLTFYWLEGMSLDIPKAHATIKDAKYYQGAIRDKGKWLKLLKGQVRLGYILGFVLKRLIQRVVDKIRHLRAITGFSVASRLCLDLAKYSEARRHLSFFFSTRDPGYDILMSESPRIAKKNIKQGDIDVVFVEDADHTFSAKSKRDELIAKFTAHLVSRYIS